MSTLIDLYLENVLSRMVVDDAQRAAIEKELRSHLEEAAATAQTKGLSREDAEREAVLAFGQLSIIARQFGFWRGAGWFYFERIAAGFFIWYFGRLLVSRWIEGTYVPIVFALIIGVWIFRSLYERIEVNGGLKVYLFPFRTFLIPFDGIERVSFEKGHILGWRNLLVRYAGTEAKISTKIRGMRAAGLALESLVGDRVDEKVKTRLRRLRLRMRREPFVLKVALTAGWLATAVLAVVGMPLVWSGYGITYCYACSFGLSLLVLGLQMEFHGNRAKKGLCILLAIVLFFSLGTIAGLIGGRIGVTRVFYIVFLSAIFVAGATIWWRWRRSYLLGMAFLVICVSCLLGAHFSRFWPGELTVAGFARGLPFDTQWSDDGQSVTWLTWETSPEARTGDTDQSKTGSRSILSIARLGREPESYYLPESVKWSMFPQQPGSNITLERCLTDDRHELYSFDPTTYLKRVETFPPNANPLYASILGVSSWSPDGTY